jgi:pimeloyl-ACP methyl ester carboxylesterase
MEQFIPIKRRRALLLMAALLLEGCAFATLRQELSDLSNYVVVSGVVGRDGGARAPAVVVLYCDAGDHYRVAAYDVLMKPGAFALMLPRDRCSLAAFEDLNRNLVYDPGEPAGYYGPVDLRGVAANTVETLRGTMSGVEGLKVTISENGTIPPDFPRDVAAGTADPPEHAGLGGPLSLKDPRFTEEYCRKGLWQPLTFLREGKGGVLPLQKYDPAKIPVLFIHGSGRSPQDWRYFIEHLDRTRYQPWVYYYPSGLPLEANAVRLNTVIERLHDEYGFDRLYVTAHSMGGLVARRFIALNAAAGNDYIDLFVSLATPWGGVPFARVGVDLLPVPIPSWADLVPEGRFIRSLHEHPIPHTVRHYLFFAYQDDPGFRLASGDGVVSLESQLDQWAQARAAGVMGFNEDHMGVLTSRAAFAAYACVLETAASGNGAGRCRDTLREPTNHRDARPTIRASQDPAASDQDRWITSGNI